MLMNAIYAKCLKSCMVYIVEFIPRRKQDVYHQLKKIKKVEEKDKEKAVAEKRSQLVAKMKESIKDEDWINSYLAEISITEETDVEAKAKDYIAFYNKTQSGGGKITPKKTGGEQDTDSEVKNTLAAAKAIMQQRQGIMGGSPVKTTTEN